MKKRLWSLIIAMMMLLTLIPASAYGAPSGELKFRWGFWSENGVIEDQNMQFSTVLEDSPGFQRELFFYYEDSNGIVRVPASQLKSADENVVKVSPSKQNGDATAVEIVGFGSTTIDYEVAGQKYSVNVEIDIPFAGFYSAPTASQSSYIREFVVADTANTYYFVVTGDWKIDSFTLVGEHADIASYSIDASKKFVTITVTGTPQIYSNGGWYQVEYALSNATFDVTQKSNHSIRLIDGKPYIGYSWAEWNNGVATKPQNPVWQKSVQMRPGINGYYISFLEDGVEKPLKVTDVFSSNTDVIQVKQDENNPDLILIHGMDFGTASVCYTDAATGKTYELPVTIALPTFGFYSSSTPSTSTYIQEQFTVTDTQDTIYFIARDGVKFDKISLIDDFNDIATITLDATNTCATIKITGAPENYVSYGVKYTLSNLDMNGQIQEDWLYIKLCNGKSHMSILSSEGNGNVLELDCLYLTPGSAYDLWMNYSDENGASVLPLEELRSSDESVFTITLAGDPQNPDLLTIKAVGWGTAQVVYTDKTGKEYTVDIIVEIEQVDFGCYKGNVISEENWIPSEYVISNDVTTFYFMTQNGFSFDNFALKGNGKDYATIELSTDKTCAMVTISEQLNDYASYGEWDLLEFSFDIQQNGVYIGSGENGIFLINHFCSHLDTKVDGMKDATCTVDGYVGKEICKQCNEVVVEEKVIPATGHDYVNGVCADCGDKPVVADKVDKIDTTKPVDEVTPVIEQEAVDATAKDISNVVDAILSGKVTEEMKNSVSEGTLEAVEAELNAGKQIKTEIVADIVDEKEVPQSIVSLMKEDIGESGKVVQYLDLSVLVKSVAADGTEKGLGNLNVLSKNIMFTIVVPEELVKDGREFYIIRVHEDEVEKLELTQNADGTYSFETDRFSSYALAYNEMDDTKVEENQTEENKTQDNKVDNTTDDKGDQEVDEVPPTGDDSNGIIYMALLLVAFILFAVAKKKAI